MSLFSCPECQNMISDSAKTCPHCGFPLKKKSLIVKQKDKKKEATTSVADSHPAPQDSTKQKKKKEKSLIFHGIYHGFTLPLTLFFLCSELYKAFRINAFYYIPEDVGTLILLLAPSIIIFGVTTFIGFWNFKHYAYICNYLFLLCTSFYNLCLSLPVSDLLPRLIFCILVSIYYYKRRHLFAPNTKGEEDSSLIENPLPPEEIINTKH